MKKIVSLILGVVAGLFVGAQELTPLQADLREMNKETDPAKSIVIKARIIHDYKLDSLKDAETFDMLNGLVALSFARQKRFTEFEKYIGLIRNPFNKTSMLDRTANELVDQKIDEEYANKIAKQTIDVYNSFKDDPSARPENFSPDDWSRFMNFAKYPYYDTYAKTLFATKHYEEALNYQKMAFDVSPEEGMPWSVQRYVKLLELNGQKTEAKQLLVKIAAKGKLNQAMIAQLQSFFIDERGTADHFDSYLDSLQKNSRAEMLTKLKGQMLKLPAPAFSLKDLDGKTVSLSDFKGKIVVLDLWATWCVPCIASFPAMQKVVNKHPDVVFLFIAVEEKGAGALKRVKNFMTKHPYKFHVLMDQPMPKSPDRYVITSAYKPEGIPSKYFIDPAGKLQFISKGFDSDDELINEIDTIIQILKAEAPGPKSNTN